MSGKKIQKNLSKEEPKQLNEKTDCKRKVSKKVECSEVEEDKDVCKKKRLCSRSVKQKIERNVKISKCGQSGKNSCKQKQNKFKKARNSGEHSESKSVIEIKKENAADDLAVASKEKSSNVIKSKMRQRSKISEACDESVGKKTKEPDFETLTVMKYESLSSKNMPTGACNESIVSKESKLTDEDCFKSPKRVPNQCLEKCDLSLEGNGISKDSFYAKCSSLPSSLLIKNNTHFQKVNKRADKKGFKLSKRVIKENTKRTIKNNAKHNSECNVDQNLSNIPQILLINKQQRSVSKPCNNAIKSRKSSPRRKTRNLKPYHKSSNKVSSNDVSEELESDDIMDVDYTPSDIDSKNMSKLVVRKNSEALKRKKRKKSDLDKSVCQTINQSEAKKYIIELAKNNNDLLVELLHNAQIIMMEENRTKLLSSDVLHAQKLLLKEPLIFELPSTQNDLDIDLEKFMQPERYEVQRPNFQGSNMLKIRNSDFVQLSQALQDYFVAITKAIFYKDRHLFKFVVKDIKKNTCMSVLSPFVYKLAVHVIKKFFPSMFYLKRIFDVVISLIENHSALDSMELHVKEIIYLLLDYSVGCSSTSVAHENDLWSFADSTANFLARILRKCDKFSKEMYDSILLLLENVFKDTSKDFYNYYGGLAILISFGPLAIFQVMSKNFLPLCNHLSKYIKLESSVPKEALMVYGHLRSAIELLITHCSRSNSFKSTYSLQSESLSLSGDNLIFHEETEKILEFLLSNNVLQFFGDSLSSRLPVLTNCFVNHVPLSDFALQLEEVIQLSKTSSKGANKKLSGRGIKKLSPTKSKIMLSCLVSNKNLKKKKNTKLKSKQFQSCKRAIQKKQLDHLKSGIGNLYLFL